MTVPLTIVIPNWNGLAVIPACLDSLRRFAPNGTQIVVVDNRSTDGSHELLLEMDDIQLISLDRNVGFGTAVNEGAKAASAPVLCILNSDARLLSRLEHAVSWVTETGGLLGGHAVDGTGRRVPTRGRDPVWWRMFRPGSLYIDVDTTRLQAERQPFLASEWIHGAMFLVHRSNFLLVGGFDERIFLYGEEQDLCRRLRKAGFAVAYTDLFRFSHLDGYRSERLPFALAGLRYYQLKHSNLPGRILAWAALFLWSVTRGLRFVGRWLVTSERRDLLRARVALLCAMDCLVYRGSPETLQPRRSLRETR